MLKVEEEAYNYRERERKRICPQPRVVFDYLHLVGTRDVTRWKARNKCQAPHQVDRLFLSVCHDGAALLHILTLQSLVYIYRYVPTCISIPSVRPSLCVWIECIQSIGKCKMKKERKYNPYVMSSGKNVFLFPANTRRNLKAYWINISARYAI